jgi:type I restriction enzyme S subunit
VSYFLRQIDFLAYSDKAAVSGINRNHLHQAMVVCPPLPEQQAIAHILGTLDDKIELNRRMNETLEAMARAIFQSWFVDFAPVRAKAESREPGLPSHLADLFPERFENSGLGEIPAGWEIALLSKVTYVNPPRSLHKGDVAPYLHMANMPTTGARALGVHDREFGSGMRFRNGDTLVARITPCLENGKTCFVDFLEEDKVGWGSTEYIVLCPKPPLPLQFAYFLARTEGFRACAISNMSGTSGRQRVPANCFDNFELVIPPAPIASVFGHIAQTTLTKLKATDMESQTLATLRDALLPRLLSGELRVTDAERAIAAVV